MTNQYEEPFAHFDAWFEEARAAETLPEAASMATVGTDGRASNRMVLVRWRTGAGFDVFTDLESRKGEHLRANGSAALCWYWPVLQRQLRVEGTVEFLDDAAGDAYWDPRPRAAQLAAYASRQSQPIDGADVLEAAYVQAEASHTPYVGVPRPERWGGLRVAPERVEFWTQRPNRLHERVEYVLEGTGWVRRLLQP
jgi:pyridoxamine 5'-phosphate oxidase